MGTINNIIGRSFPGVNLMMISIVEDPEPKDFQSRFFMFIKAVSGITTDAGTKSYDHKGGITFKMEAEKAFAMSFALEQYALGKGKLYDEQFGNFTIFADGSKSQYGSNSKKSLSLNYYTNQKSGKTNISIFTASDSKKIPYFMTPYEAYAMSKVLNFFASECLRLEMAGPGVIVRRKIGNQQMTSQNIPQQDFKQPQNFSGQNLGFQQPSISQPQMQQNLPFNQPPQNLQQNANKVANDFAGFFGDSDAPF